SKYASPQGGNDRDSRGYENRGNQRGGFDNSRRQEGGRFSSGPAESSDDSILLPGESLAKYRGRPSAAPIEPRAEERHEAQPETDDVQPPAGALPAGGTGPR